MTKQEYYDNVALLNKYAHYYYVLDDPLTTDDVYDRLYHEVVAFEEENSALILKESPTQRVGGTPLDKFTKASHPSRMWSLEDIFNAEELQKWLDKTGKLVDDISFYCEPKFDGASLNLIYENGELVQAITRGDGVIGEAVTQNAKTIQSVPLKITHQGKIEIRGEVVIFKDEFEKINIERAKRVKHSLPTHVTLLLVHFVSLTLR